MPPLTRCTYPAHPTPVPLRLTTLPEHPCPYLPGLEARSRAFMAEEVDPDIYHNFMDAGFRRSGRLFYQPTCRTCRQCLPLRVPVEAFRPNKSQRRCVSRNADLTVTEVDPTPTDEKYAVYQNYVTQWHAGTMESDRAGFERFLYDSPVRTREFEYRDATGRLLAAGLADVCGRSFSSVYFYFDPAERVRSLGTFAVLWEMDYCRRAGVPFYYFGYWVRDCGAMAYKANFKPCEVLGSDGAWRPMDQTAEPV